MRENPFDVLIGEEINAVCFVMDYVEVHFNGPILRALANPTLEFERERHEFPLPGSRDALCSLIGSEAQAFEVEEDLRFRMLTRAGHVLSVPLSQEARVGPEAAQLFLGEGEPMYVW